MTATTTRTFTPQTAYRLRNLKVNKALSQETECFSADIYLGDEKVGSTANRGCGGTHETFFASKDAREAFETVALSLGESPSWAEESLINLLVAETEIMKHAKKYITFVVEGDEQGVFVVTKRGRKKMRASDIEGRDQVLASNPDLLWVDPATV